MSSPQEPSAPPPESSLSKSGSWLRLNWHLLVPLLTFVASLFIAVGSIWNARIQVVSLHNDIRSEYERRWQATELDMREEMRHIRDELSRLRDLIDEVDDHVPRATDMDGRDGE